ncbi:MAG: 3-oxoacyl-[acyl-carrier protein] reductase [Flavobacteriales bacterium]|jgi:3-oxoacyl-[acyl-carrier protein] reductase
MNILITGGASGFGESITKSLAIEEHTIYFTYNNSEKAARNLESLYPNTIGLKCDFTSSESVSELIDKLGQINLDVLINNAYSGKFLDTHFHKTSSESFLLDFKSNILPTIEITQAVIKGFRKRKSGRIITVLTSVLAGTAPVGSSSYVSVKAYLKKMTQMWAVENSKFNITSNTVSPSFMRTELTNSIDERVTDQIRSQNPNGNLLLTDEASESVRFLVNASKQINGLDLVINAASDFS